MRYITGTNSTGNKCKVEEDMLEYYLERAFVPDEEGAKLLAQIRAEQAKPGDKPIDSDLNKDGQVDEKDLSIAGQVLVEGKKDEDEEFAELEALEAEEKVKAKK